MESFYTFERANDHDGVLLSRGMRSFIGSDSLCSPSSLVLDSLKGEFVAAPAKLERKVAVPERSTEALKNHSQAERRRRARINSHFDTLRSLIPGANKMDKSSLLGEVINNLKDLKRKAKEASEQHSVIPKDIDEVKVEQDQDDQFGQGTRPSNYWSMRVSMSCDYRPGLLSDLRRAFDSLNLVTTSVEMSTLGYRMKNVFVITNGREEENNLVDHNEILLRRRFHARSICHAVTSVIENNVSSSSPFSNKRKRVFYI